MIQETITHHKMASKIKYMYLHRYWNNDSKNLILTLVQVGLRPVVAPDGIFS